MAKKSESQIKRVEIPYFEGINTLVGHNLAKKEELVMSENARSKEIGIVEKRGGYRRLGADLSATANFGITYFESSNGSSKHFWRVSTVSASTDVYYLNTSDGWTKMGADLQGLTAAKVSFTQAEGCLFIVNGTDVNKQIRADGVSIANSDDANDTLSSIRNSLKAYKINYYKDRLYIGDYYEGSTRYKTGIMHSSYPLGILALVDGDQTISTGTEMKVTDPKFFYKCASVSSPEEVTDGLPYDIYRGDTKLARFNISEKTENTVTISYLVVYAGGASVDLLSSDEIWVMNSYSNEKRMLWADNPKSGEDIKRYDTFKLTGIDNSAITMMENIGDVMLISNKTSMAVWDDKNPTNFDLAIGCVSDEGWVKALGTLFFIDYNGIYATTGGRPILMSSKIQKIFDGATKAGLEAGVMGKKGFYIFASLGDVTLYNKDGSTDRTLSDVVVEYNLKTENWYVHTGIAASYFSNYYTSTDIERLEFCEDGEVYEIMYGTKDNNTDEIPLRIDTTPITLASEFENIVYPKQIIIESEQGSSIKCFVSLDDDDWYEIKGEARKGCTILEVTARHDTDDPARCRKIALSIREFSKTNCKISRVTLLYANTPEEEKSHD